MSATDTTNIKSIMTKRPWLRIRPIDDMHTLAEIQGIGHRLADDIPYSPGNATYSVYTQSEMLAEYNPSGHRILSEAFYPNVIRAVDEPMYNADGTPVIDVNGEQKTVVRYYSEAVPRHAFAFQRIIAAAHIYHATTNDIQHELAIEEPSEKDEQLFNRICSGWQRDKMENMWYELFRGREIVGEAAFVGHISTTGDEIDGTVRHSKSFRVFSFEKGDKLFPQYDAQGKLIVFARLTEQYNEDGNRVQTIEVWDERYLTTYQQGGDESNPVFRKIKSFFGISGDWKQVSKTTHGFPFIPVAYIRNDNGPGWWASQGNIEDYEFTFSQMAHNNQAYGNSILVMKSGSDTLPDITRGLDGTVKAIYMGKDDDAKFLEGQSASESYMRQLDKLEEMIYRDSNIVKSPTDLKSGDTPATAIKLLFTPNMMQCSMDLTDCSDALDTMWNIYAYAYGFCTKGESFTECQALPVTNWAQPHVPISESAVTADLTALVGAKIISRDTASRRASFYSMPNEDRKIQKEQKAQQDLELTYEIDTIKANARYSNGHINTGGGGTRGGEKKDGDGDGIFDEGAN